MLKLKEAKEITGHKSGLGKTSKMPGYSTSLSAFKCKTGNKLSKVKGSVCEKCYAMRGNYTFPVVKKAHEKRRLALKDPRWVEAMTLLISKSVSSDDPYFRIHDSGDFQSEEHILNWVRVALNTPNVKFWAPTKEYLMVKRVMNMVKDWPDNLVIRFSAPMVGQKPPKSLKGYLTSTVDSGEGQGCPAPKQKNSCGDCRACWNTKISNIDYHKH